MNELAVIFCRIDEKGMVLISAILDKGSLSRHSREGGNLSWFVDQDSRSLLKVSQIQCGNDGAAEVRTNPDEKIKIKAQ